MCCKLAKSLLPQAVKWPRVWDSSKYSYILTYLITNCICTAILLISLLLFTALLAIIKVAILTHQYLLQLQLLLLAARTKYWHTNTGTPIWCDILVYGILYWCTVSIASTALGLRVCNGTLVPCLQYVSLAAPVLVCNTGQSFVERGGGTGISTPHPQELQVLKK